MAEATARIFGARISTEAYRHDRRLSSLTVDPLPTEPSDDPASTAPRAGSVLIVAAVVALVISTGLTARPLWDQLDTYRSLYGPLTAFERERTAGTQNAFDAASWDELRARIHRGDRYALIGQPETSQDAAVENLVARTYASFWLLPAIQVRAPENANVLVYFKPATPPAGAECFPSPRPVCVRRVG